MSYDVVLNDWRGRDSFTVKPPSDVSQNVMGSSSTITVSSVKIHQVVFM